MPTATATSAFTTILNPVHTYKKKKKKKKRSKDSDNDDDDSKVTLQEQNGPTMPKRIRVKYGSNSFTIDVEERNLQKEVKKRNRAPKST